VDIDAIVGEVAAAVGLAEGESGVRDVLRAVARAEPVPTSQVSRTAQLPVPIVTAVCNELRKRGVIDRTRPVRLTDQARDLLNAHAAQFDGTCPYCGGLGLLIPPELKALTDELEQVAAGAPQARLELDQTHCTVATKLHRVLLMHETGALDGKDIVLLGDDDLISIAIAKFAAATGTAARLKSITVIDTDPAVLGWIEQQTAGSGVTVRLAERDLREALPPDLTESFDVACTDPPYTVAGAALFLSRAVSALRRQPGQHVFFSFGARRPAETLDTQRLIADLGLTVRAVIPNFNSYVGVGILAGSSNLYHLRSTEDTTPLIEAGYEGPLYTADTRPDQTRPYRCATCGTTHVVGTLGPASASRPADPGADGADEAPGTGGVTDTAKEAPKWATIADLKAAGCPACGGTTFRPLPRRQR
jgi:N4-bis(aminopropyl)spermidine synthase